MSALGVGKKRAALPKHLEKLDVAAEREKSAKARQNRAGADSGDAPTTGSNERPETAHEKSPTKQHGNSVNKIAVESATPTKRPVSAPVKPTTSSTVRSGSRPSLSRPPSTTAAAKPRQQHQPAVWESSSGTDGNARVTKAIEVKSQRTTMYNTIGDADEGDLTGKHSNDCPDAETPARGHYGIFVQTRNCEDLCLGLGLTLKHIRRMKKLYDANDMYCTGEITQAEFFFMIKEEKRPISKSIFKLAGIGQDQKFISFDQYALCVVQFASLTKPELFQFVFDLYDDDHSGSLDKGEFTKMSKELQSEQFCFSKNVTIAIKMLGIGGDGTEDGLVDIVQFMKFARNTPVAFYPFINMQKNIRAATLGESFWSRIVERKMKIQDLLSHMRRNSGVIPQLTVRERIWGLFSSDVYYIRKRAGELYATELKQRRRIGSTDRTRVD